MKADATPREGFADYARRLKDAIDAAQWDGVEALALAMRECWRNGCQVFFCGNGGSAGNAVHLVNDYVYGVAKGKGVGIRAIALPANVSVVTCLANDVGYEEIFSAQIEVQGQAGDVLVVLSGSGNSPNIVRALETARKMKIKSFAILGYTGGKAKPLADTALHFPVHDMQISEDLQLVVGHMVMQWLARNPVA